MHEEEDDDEMMERRDYEREKRILFPFDVSIVSLRKCIRILRT